MAQSVIAVAMVFVLCGTPRALDRFIPHYSAHEEQGKIRGLILNILRLTSLLGAVVVIAILALSRTLAMSTFCNPQLLPVLRLMVISVPALAWIEIVSMSFAGFKELRYRVYTHQLSLPVLKTALALAVLSLGYGLLGWIYAYLAALFLTSALAWWFFRSRIWSTVGRVPTAAIDLKGIVSYCWPLSVNNLVVMLSGH
ncbi:MAG: oligosaccharide flippase family protein, partial [Candidatus Eisenbacteria sp.]|nr:oligosaccharide flippase family protein [Candidatus Eisenbacteria bacterium]